MTNSFYGKLLLGSFLAAALVLPLPAHADGTVRVQQPDGSVQLYDVTFRVENKTLRITTSNNKGTVVVADAACTMIDKLLRCLPYSAHLEQNGTHPLDFDRGTVYFNTSGDTQTMKYSSTRIPPKGLVGTLKSQRGTYMSFSGTLDSKGP